MKTKRKVACIVFMLLALLLCVIAFTFSACTTSASAETIGAETELPETFGSRVQRWFEENFLQFIGSSTFGVVVANIITLIADHKSNKKNTKQTLVTLDKNTQSNDAVVGRVNSLIEAHNEMVQRLDLIDSRNTEFKILYDQMLVMQKAVLEILATVYANNKNIPQGVKDLVSLRYVGALKRIEQNPNDMPPVVADTTEGD